MTRPRISMTRPEGPENAPVVVLGPSLGTSSILWDLVAPSLSERFRVVRWDLPGHGPAPAATDAFTVDDLADDVAAGLVEIGVTAPVTYAGVSLGGAVGQAFALRHPARVRALVTLCSAARFGEPSAWIERAATVRSTGTASLVVPSAGRWFAPGSMERQPELSGRLLHTLRDADDESYARCCEALAGFDVRARLAEIEHPVLAIYGEADQVTPRASSEEIASGVRDGRAVGVAEAAHLAPAEQPAAVLALLVPFIEGARA